MTDIKLGVIESRFADIIWRNEPLSSSQLAKLAEKELEWKKSTTYTILKRLCERGIFQNQSGIVSSIISKEEFYALQSEKFVEETFDGSLPAFLTAFSTRKKLSEEEFDSLMNIIENMSSDHKVIAIDAAKTAHDLGNPKCSNVVLLGVAAKHMDYSKDEWLSVIESTVPSKTVEINKKAFLAGYERG